MAILLREIRYGIELSFSNVSVQPMPPQPFHYHIGNVNIDYNPHGTTTIRVPPSGAGGRAREFRLMGMRPSAHYRVVAGTECAAAAEMTESGEIEANIQSDVDGTLHFSTFAHCGVSITLI